LEFAQAKKDSAKESEMKLICALLETGTFHQVKAAPHALEQNEESKVQKAPSDFLNCLNH
jgi:hypothetical protein